MLRTIRRILFLLIVATPGTALPADEVLLSRPLMEAQGLAVGDEVLLSTSQDGSAARPFTIVGQFEPLPDPFRLTARRFEARLHLPELIELRGATDPVRAESVTRINVALKDPADLDAFTRDVYAKMPGILVRPTDRAGDGSDPFVVLERFHVAIAMVTVIGSAAFLLALMVIRSEERRENAGILRLIGFSRPRILLGVFVEGVVIAVVGAAVGILISLGLEDLFNRFFQWRYDTALVFVRVTPGIAVKCIAISVPLGVLAGIAASWSLLRRNIMTLLRR